MVKTLAVLATAATVAVSAIAMPTAAEARWWGGPAWGWHAGWRGPGWGWGWRAPFWGGVAAGAVVGGAVAASSWGCWRTTWNGWRWVRVWVC
jgi:hypothetical protein